MRLVLVFEYIVYAQLYSFWLRLFFLFFVLFLYKKVGFWPLAFTFRIILHNTFKIIIQLYNNILNNIY